MHSLQKLPRPSLRFFAGGYMSSDLTTRQSRQSFSVVGKTSCLCSSLPDNLHYSPPFCTNPLTNSSALASRVSSISSSRASTSSVSLPTRSWTSEVSSTATSSTSSVFRVAFSCPPPLSLV